MKKRRKEEVDYSKGMKARHCGICRFFIQPNACQKVQGRISPSMWCRLFRKREQ